MARSIASLSLPCTCTPVDDDLRRVDLRDRRARGRRRVGAPCDRTLPACPSSRGNPSSRSAGSSPPGRILRQAAEQLVSRRTRRAALAGEELDHRARLRGRGAHGSNEQNASRETPRDPISFLSPAVFGSVGGTAAAVTKIENCPFTDHSIRGEQARWGRTDDRHDGSPSSVARHPVFVHAASWRST